MNDLIGLAYRWGCRPGDGSGCTDCFQLVCAVRRQLGLPDHAAQFEWVYQEHTAETFGLLHLRRLLASLADPVAAALPGDPILLGGAAAALGVMVMLIIIKGNGKYNISHIGITKKVKSRNKKVGFMLILKMILFMKKKNINSIEVNK